MATSHAIPRQPLRGSLPAPNREYSGNSNTRGRASFIGGGQNAGRDIINIFAEVVYYSRKRKEAPTPEQELEKQAWRDFKQSLKGLGLDLVALNEHQIDLLLEAIARITGAHADRERTEGTGPELPVPGSFPSEEDQEEWTDSSYSSEDSGSIDGDTGEAAFRQQSVDGFGGGLANFGGHVITEAQISTLQNPLESIRHHYSSELVPVPRGNVGPPTSSYGRNETGTTVVPKPLFSVGQYSHELSSYEYPENLLALPSHLDQTEAPFIKAGWTKVQKELKQIGVRVKFVPDRGQSYSPSFSNRELQSFREWCLASKSSSDELDSWCTEEARPFIRAVRDNDEIEVRILLFRGTNVDTLLINGMSALHIAVEKKALPIVNLLMDFGASIEMDGDLQVTPLHQAAAGKDHFEIVDALLSKGGRVNLRGAQGWQAIHVATRWGHTSIIKALLAKGADIEAKTDFGATPLLIAASGNQTACVQYLLDQGAEVDATDVYGITALFHATFRNSIATVTALLDNGALIHHLDRTQATVLHHAIKHGFQELAELFLSRGALVDACDYLRYTPLHIAASQGPVDLVKCLLRYGSYVDSLNTDGNTPLHLAAVQGRFDIVEMLLQNSASTKLTNSFGMSPLTLSISSLHYTTIKLLLDHGTLLDNELSPPPIWLAIQSSHNNWLFSWLQTDPTEAIIKLFLEREIMIDRPEKTTQMNALCLAVERNSISLVNQLLASRRCDLESPCGPRRASALHFAVSVPMVDILIKNGANINAPDSRGLTALHVAAMYNNFEIAEFLLANGIHSDLVDHTGSSAMLLAIVWGSYEVVNLLLEWRHGWINKEIEYALRFRCKISDVQSEINRKMAQALLSKIPSLKMPMELTQDLSRPVSSTSSYYGDYARNSNNYEIISNSTIPILDSGPSLRHDLLGLDKHTSFPNSGPQHTDERPLRDEDTARSTRTQAQEAVESETIVPEVPSSSHGPELGFKSYKHPTVEDDPNDFSNHGESSSHRELNNHEFNKDGKSNSHETNDVEDTLSLEKSTNPDAVLADSSIPTQDEQSLTIPKPVDEPGPQREQHALEFIQHPSEPEPVINQQGPQHDQRALEQALAAAIPTEDNPSQTRRGKKSSTPRTTKRKHGQQSRSSNTQTPQRTNIWNRMFK